MRMKTSQLVESDLRWCEVWRRGGRVAQQELSKWGEVFCWWLETRETCRIVGSTEGMLASTAPLYSPLHSVIFSERWEVPWWQAELQVRQSAARDTANGGLMLLSTRVWYGPWTTFPGQRRPLTIEGVALKESVTVDGELTFRLHAQWSYSWM